MIKTAVVILNWNGLGFLKRFLGNVVRQSYGNNTIVFVADNNSDDGSVEWVKSNLPEITLVSLDKNYGFAGGYNRALSRIEAKYYILLNSDIEVTPGWTVPLINFLENNPDAASCQPKILSYAERDRFEHAGAAGGFIDKYGFPFCRGRILNKTEKDSGQYDDMTEIFWSSGACMAVRAEYWKRFGGFDDDFFAHMEEIDLCWRFGKLGLKVVYIPDSVVYHVGGGTLPYSSPFKVYLNFRNSLFMLYKNLPARKLNRILFIRKVMDGMAFLLFISKGDFAAAGSVWKAHLDYYKKLKLLKEKRKTVKTLADNGSEKLIMNKSIIFEFYIKGHITYRSITRTSKNE
jgi:GT2 family glycosyltransferase